MRSSEYLNTFQFRVNIQMKKIGPRYLNISNLTSCKITSENEQISVLECQGLEPSSKNI